MLEVVLVFVPELLELLSVSVVSFPVKLFVVFVVLLAVELFSAVAVPLAWPVLEPDLLVDPEPDRSIPSVTVSVRS